MTKCVIARLLPLAVLSILMPRSGAAQATTFETLYSFQGSPDGANPSGGVVIGKNGILYGTTSGGGTSRNGTVFALTPASSVPWEETVLFNFNGGDGAGPDSTLIFGSAGAFYGTTSGGGANGGGTVFELAQPSTAGGAWTETVLYSVDGYGSQDDTPNGTLAVGPSGALYITTQGSPSPEGVIYGGADVVIPPATPGGAWTGQVIYSFAGTGGMYGGPAGILPFAGLVSEGVALFGTTYASGDIYCSVYGCGVVYELIPPATQGGAWTATAIHDFTGASSDGGFPRAALTVAPGGVLYGTTSYGGSGACSSDAGVFMGCGTVFELTPPATSGGTWTESVLYSFTGANGDGANPTASVIVGKNGVLYGTTQNGGEATSSGSPCSLAGCGTVFGLTPPTTPGGAWTETVLHSFSGRNGQGSLPAAGLALSPSGVLYGTTSTGGASGYGTVFAVKP